jgi:hypothetical protein
MLLLTGCSHDRMIRSKLQESEWYKSQQAWVAEKNGAPIRLGKAYIVVGQIKEIKYNYPEKKLEELTISPVYYLETPSLWTKWFSPNSMSLGAGSYKFGKEDFPTLDEYWAFKVFQGFKAYRPSINSAVRLIYDADTDSLKIIGPGNEELVH